MRKVNRYREAFKENFNAVGLASALALSAATLHIAPFLLGLVVEAAYLLVVPDTKWYEKRLAKRFDDEVIRRRQRFKDQTLPLLRPAMQARFQRLEATRAQIDTQAQEDQTWFREVLRKLDYLLEKFLVFAGKEAEFRDYLQSLHAEVRNERQSGRAGEAKPRRDRDEGRRGNRPADSRTLLDLSTEYAASANASGDDAADQWTHQAVTEVQAHYAQERERLAKRLEEEQDPNTRSVLEKRADVLERRSEFVDKIGRILTNLNHQLQLVEDTFGLINDEIRARSPEQILSDIEEVVVATDTMSTTLEELASLDQMVARVGN